jgi:endoglycosylceramidase
VKSRAFLWALAAGSAMALALAAVARASDATGWARAGIIQAPGGLYLTDGLGRRLELHGVNLVGKCGGGAVPTSAPGTPCVGPAVGPQLAYVLSPAATDPGRRFTAADAQTLASLGFNTVRLGIVWEGLEPGAPGAGPDDPVYCAPHRRGRPFPALGGANPYDPATVQAYLGHTDQIVELLAQVGIRVVIDMHQDAWGSVFFNPLGSSPWNAEGAPPWATCTNHVPFKAPAGWGSAYYSRAVRTAIHHFWLNDVQGNLQGQLARVWEAVAGHYRHNPDVIGYEVLNEPNDFDVKRVDPELQCAYGGPVHEPSSCATSHAAALPDGFIGAIKSADPGHVVFFEPSGDTGFGAPETIGITEPLRFHDLALAYHVYGSATTQLPEVTRERALTRTGQPGGPPAVMDEFGASNHTSSTARTVNLAQAGNVSWAYWAALQLDDPTAGDGFEGLLDETTRQPISAQAQALVVPYPWATAGTPGLQAFNRTTRTFRYAYQVDHTVRAPTQISLPTYVYPSGYRVTVTGATVTSRRNSPLLKLSARRRAAQVKVTVRAVG